MPPEDPDAEVTGSIFRYLIDWDEDDKFVLEDFVVTTVYEGSGPTDCTIDSLGNLAFATKDDSIKVISYSDIGTPNSEWIVASGDPNKVDGCQAIEFRDDNRLMWVNNGESAETLSGLR